MCLRVIRLVFRFHISCLPHYIWSFKMTKYVCMDQGCLCVCVCAFKCVDSTAEMARTILMKIIKSLNYITNVHMLISI